MTASTCRFDVELVKSSFPEFSTSTTRNSSDVCRQVRVRGDCNGSFQIHIAHRDSISAQQYLNQLCRRRNLVKPQQVL
jgi:hypothetical protein